jgi:hypothetical protein
MARAIQIYVTVHLFDFRPWTGSPAPVKKAGDRTACLSFACLAHLAMSGDSLTIQPNSLSRSGSGMLASVEPQIDVLTGTTPAYVLSGSGALTSVQSTLDALTGLPQADVLSAARADSVVPSSITVSRVGDGRASAAAGSTIQITYHGYPPAAQAAFDYAAKLWASILISTVPITIDAFWRPLSGNTLGSAGPNNLARWTSAPAGALPNTWYSIALANQISGIDLDPLAADLTSTLNCDRPDWYFGTDGKTPAGKINFVSIALHEILHGIGNIGTVGYNSSTGQGG